jgi:uncharacterized membrane protein YGL010W
MAATTNTFINYLADYASYHKTPGNKMTHHVGIPMITVAIAGMLSKIVFGPTFAAGLMQWDLALLASLAVAVWYLSMDWKIGLPSSIVMLGVYLLGRQLNIYALVAMFVVGWIIQYVGHIKYEHNRPAFYKNLEHLLIGPVWIFGAWFGYLPAIPNKYAAQPASADVAA